MMATGNSIIVVDFGVSKRLFSLKVLTNALDYSVYTASGELIHFVGFGDVGGIPDCQNVSTLQKVCPMLM